MLFSVLSISALMFAIDISGSWRIACSIPFPKQWFRFKTCSSLSLTSWILSAHAEALLRVLHMLHNFLVLLTFLLNFLLLLTLSHRMCWKLWPYIYKIGLEMPAGKVECNLYSTHDKRDLWACSLRCLVRVLCAWLEATDSGCFCIAVTTLACVHKKPPTIILK